MKMYSDDAKERVARQGIVAISDFINAAPASTRAKCLSSLAPIPGFRKGSQLAVKEQFKKLFHSLSHTSDPRFRSDGAEWKALGSIWIYHVILNFGSENLPEHSTQVISDEAATFDYFSKLINERGDEGCSREEIEPLYRFSGYPNSQKLEALIARLPSKEVIERQRKLARLPSDVEQVRERLERVEAGSLRVEKTLEALRASARVHKDDSEIKRLVTQIDTRLHDYQSQLDDAARKAEAVSNKIEARLTPIEKNALDSKAEIGRLNEAYLGLTATFRSLNQAVTLLESSLVELDRGIDNKLSELKPTRRTTDEPGVSVSGHSPLLLITSPKSGSINPKQISNTKEAIGFLSTCIVSIGVQAVEANELARVMLAAAFNGQLIQLKGSFANLLAQTACSALGGGEYITWDVPMGLCDGSEMRSVIAQLQNYDTKEKCIFMRGINKSAFEIYGDDLKDLLVENFVKATPNPPSIFAVATWAEGPATLPGGPILSSLGPIINTDNLHWGRAKPDRKLTATLDVNACISKNRGDVDPEEVADITTELVAAFLPCSQLQRRALNVTVASLLCVCDEDNALVSRLALTYWGLPWAAAIGLSQERVSSAIQKILPDVLTISTVSRALDELTPESDN